MSSLTSSISPSPPPLTLGTPFPSIPPELETEHLILRPFNSETDSEGLWKGTHGNQADEGWKYFVYGPFPSPEALGNFLNDRSMFPVSQYTVRIKSTGEVAGRLGYLNASGEHRRVEIGAIMYPPAFQRTFVNTEAVYALMKCAFEQLGVRRVEWKCHGENDKSKAAAVRLGFKFEGTFRQHMITKGHNRDTCWYSILDSEWPEVRENLERKMASYKK